MNYKPNKYVKNIDSSNNYMIIDSKDTLTTNELELLKKDGWELISITYCCLLSHVFKRLSETQKTMKGCGKIWADESDEYYSEDAMRRVAPMRKCGETFDENGKDYCDECSSKQENTTQEDRQ